MPIAWEAVPIDIPTATSSLILKILQTIGDIIAPIIPVIIIAETVIEGIPPINFETSIPMGVVIDLGRRE